MGARLATEHLLSLGHRTVWHVAVLVLASAPLLAGGAGQAPQVAPLPTRLTDQQFWQLSRKFLVVSAAPVIIHNEHSTVHEMERPLAQRAILKWGRKRSIQPENHTD